ncbi:ATP-binding protein [Rhizobacter sp. SG703]|uniref:ATP-binding protein n=1 Tax=Rhizobacter sp. SG703 TaxID=2587140 RepID=UPI0014450537|nr:ATP-binding protein [Rhizobacter sp. SG703]NKI96571.1 signal transduction histidine kinase [Rhizobacter sp. SG703]
MVDASLRFLERGGEMGERMRAFDWGRTPLGDPRGWPQSLKTIVRVMLDSRFAMWMAWGSEATFFCNDAYLPTVGIKRDWVLGARADVVWAEIWHDIGPRIGQVLSTGTATWDEGLQLFLERSGYPEETFHTFSYSPVYDDAGGVAGMLCVVVEDTGRAIGERRLRLLRELAALPIRELPSLAAAAAQLVSTLGNSPQDLPFAALYLPDAADGRGPELARVTQTANVPPDALPRRLARDATSPLPVRQAELSGLPQLADGIAAHFGEIRGAWTEPVQQAVVLPLVVAGQAPNVGALVVGISPRRRLDDDYRSFLSLVASQVASRLGEVRARLEERQKAEALAELDRAKNLFFSNVSHELRTPLTLMLGPLQDALLRPDLPPDLAEALRLAHRNGERLRKLVNSLLEFSRIEAGRVEASYQPTDLAALTRDFASAFRSAIEHAGLRFVVDCEALANEVFVDVDMWEKVVLNLLSNAFKFTFDGEIALSLRTEAGEAVLEVRDTGIGMDDDALAHVFDRFHRVAGARSRSHEGTGIGLALVKELVRLHGGSVTVTSAPGRGSCFTVRVPLGAAHLPAHRVGVAPAAVGAPAALDAFVEDALRAGHAPPVAQRPERAADASRATVLVVDDNADMRSYIAGVLGARWNVEGAADGLQALDAIARRRPDVVVTDVMMPALDGFGLLERIRGHDALRTLPVILLSAHAGEEARLHGLAKGADDYVVKPFSARELAARVEVLLVREQMHAVRDAANRRLVAVFDNAPVAVALLDGPQHVFSYANDEQRRLVGDRPLLGLPLMQALPELQGLGLQEVLARVMRTGEPHFEKAFEVRMSGPRYFDFVYQPLTEPDGAEPVKIAVVAYEVTEQLGARQQAEDASRAKDEFLAMLGHELRNPLAPILTALHLMRMNWQDAAIKERGIIERQVRHMVRLVDDLLDVARITRGRVELQRAPLDLGTVIGQAVETVSPLFEQKRQRLQVQVAQDLPLHGDAVRLGQIVANLLTNATKFTEVGGHVTLHARRDGDDALLEVEDEGIGMSSDELAVVFEPFVQGKRQALNRPHGGLGLGLAIARSLAALHGGTLGAQSDGPGRGSRFTLRLPLLAADVRAEAPAAADAWRVAANDSVRRVLVVDDNQDAATTMATLLEALGHRPLVAHDGPSALQLLEQHPVDIAVLDIGLPVMDGYELAQRIRAKAGGSVLKLIALTGYGQADDRLKSAAHGFDEHLVKPVDMDTLLQLLR